jgi:hypothetical protein
LANLLGHRSSNGVALTFQFLQFKETCHIDGDHSFKIVERQIEDTQSVLAELDFRNLEEFIGGNALFAIRLTADGQGSKEIKFIFPFLAVGQASKGTHNESLKE